MKLKFVLTTLALGAGLAMAQNANQGVTRAEITLGTIQDLSGPLAGYGKQARNGMQLRIDELNEQGGIQGRKAKLLVEDSSYDPKKAVLAAQKLVNQDKIFAMVGHMGTAQNLAAMPVLLEKNIINFFPLSASRDLFEPVHRLKYAFLPTYFDQARIAAPRLMKERNFTKACIIYQDDDFGLELLRGAEAGLKVINMEFVEKTSFKRGATDFSTQVAKLSAAGCELVVLGTVIRETVATIGTARKTGFNPVFVASAAAYTDLIPKLGGKAMDGLYATMTAKQPYLDELAQPVRFWASKYQTKFNEDPTVFSVYGYYAIDSFVRAAQKAGPELTTDSFVKAMDSITISGDAFGSALATFSPSKHLGSPYSRLSQLQDGKWKVVSDYAGFNGLKMVPQKDGRNNVTSEFFND